MQAKKIIRVVFVEDDKWSRETFAAEIQRAGGFVCIGSYATAEDAVKGVPDNVPDVVVLDINLPGMSGIECLRLLKPLSPDTRFLMLTAYGENERIFQALLAGAGGYLLKRAGESELVEAIRQVYEGDCPMSQAIARQVVLHFNQMGDGGPGMSQLTTRERQVLEFLACGATNKEIADQLALSVHTIRLEVRHIYAKLQVRSRGEATAKLLQRL